MPNDAIIWYVAKSNNSKFMSGEAVIIDGIFNPYYESTPLLNVFVDVIDNETSKYSFTLATEKIGGLEKLGFTLEVQEDSIESLNFLFSYGENDGTCLTNLYLLRATVEETHNKRL